MPHFNSLIRKTTLGTRRKATCLFFILLGSATISKGALLVSEVSIPTGGISVAQGSVLQINLPQRNIAGFSINVNYVGTPEEEALFTAAAAAWESRITGYRGVMSLSSITINATVAAIDGPGGVLGSAGPTFVSIQDEDGVAGGSKFALATEGDMTFDSADSSALTQAVIEHEMGHVLGIGTLWNTDSFGGSFAGTQSLYVDGSGQFTGAAATARWQSEFGQTDDFVPVELGGGSGTANGHWNEVDGGAGLTGITQTITGNDMRNELMTGWLNAPAFVSQMTLDSLYDIGFTVVPEPSSGLLILLGGLPLFRRRRSGRGC